MFVYLYKCMYFCMYRCICTNSEVQYMEKIGISKKGKTI